MVCLLRRVARYDLQARSVESVNSLPLRKIARDLGFTRSKGHVDANNMPQLMSDRNDIDMVCARVTQYHMLFKIICITLERYDPPVPVANLLNNQ